MDTEETQVVQHDPKLIEIRGRRLEPVREDEPEQDTLNEAARKVETPDEE